MPVDANHEDHGSGWKGLTKEDYQRAAEEAGSIRGAARMLDVSRPTVKEQWERYGIVNPQTGEIPGESVND